MAEEIKYLSKVNVLGTEYSIKDTEARESINDIREAGLSIVIKDQAWVNNNDNAAASKGQLILVADPTAESGTYTEYVAVNTGSAYVFEKIGTTSADLTDYLKVGAKVSVDTVDSGTVSAATAGDYSVTGQSGVQVPQSIKGFSVPTVTGVGITKNSGASAKYQKPATLSVGGVKASGGNAANYTPAGKVTLPKLKTTVTPSTSSFKVGATDGTPYTITPGNVEHATDTTKDVVNASVNGETLTFTKVSPITAVGKITYTAPVLSGSLPTFKNQNLTTGISSSTSDYESTNSTKVINLAGEGAHLSAEIASWEDADAAVTDATYTASVNAGTKPITLEFGDDKVEAAAKGGKVTVNGGNKTVNLKKTAKTVTVQQA